MSAYKFSKSCAYANLFALAKDAPRLNSPGILDKKRFEAYSAKACGLQFLYATERVDETILEALNSLAKEAQALEKMEKMQQGAVVNAICGVNSENRKVLHTACRFFSLKEPLKQEEQKLAEKEWEKLKAFIESAECKSYTDLVVIGIGGSDLGPFAAHYALESLVEKPRPVHFINNLDPDLLHKKMEKIPLETCLVAIVSKSGSTLETKVNDESLRKVFQNQGLSPEKQFISITCPGSSLDDKKRFSHTFYLWEWVGGRFSCTSMVGCFPLAFSLGTTLVEKFLLGSAEMDRAALNPSLKSNLPLLGALLSIWNRNFLHLPTQAIIPYSDALKYFPAHFQQVEMESNGKSITKDAGLVDFPTGMVVWGEPGTCSQHSFFQLLHQGELQAYIEFVGFINSQMGKDFEMEGTTSQQKLLANLFAQSYALASGEKSDNPNKVFSGNRPSHIILGNTLDSYAVGAYLAYLEHKAAFEGFLWNINSFDQEGVQLGKRLANELIEGFAKQNAGEEINKEGAFCFMEFLS